MAMHRVTIGPFERRIDQWGIDVVRWTRTGLSLATMGALAGWHRLVSSVHAREPGAVEQPVSDGAGGSCNDAWAVRKHERN